MATAELTAQRLRELLHYDPETGVFTWRVRHSARAAKGSAAGSRTTKGHIEIGIDGSRFYAHRLVWLYLTDKWPAQKIDHRDGDGGNNAKDNLRDASDALNQENQRAPHANNQSGFLGITLNGKRWAARITAGGQRIYIGRFGSPEEAHAAYLTAKRKMHAGCTL